MCIARVIKNEEEKSHTEAEKRTVVAKGWGFGVRNRERLAKCSVVR